MERRTKFFWAMCLLFCAVIAYNVVAPGSAKAQNTKVVVDHWEIPFLNCLTGPIASIGEYMAWSANRAAQEINEAGGISGKPVKIIDHDTGVSPEKATVEMSKIVDDALVALGPVPEACIMAAMPIAVKKKLYSMTSSTTYEYASKYFPWSISWYPPTDKVLPFVTESWAKLHPDMKSVVQFLEKWATWPIMGDAHLKGIENAGVKNLGNIEVPVDAVMFGPLVVKALAKKPDGIILTCNAEKAARIIIELKKHGWKDFSKILIFLSADDGPLYTIGGANLEGCSLYNFTDPNVSTPRWVAMVEAFKKDHNGMEPFSLVSNYYDSVYMVKDAIEKTGVTGDPKLLHEERVKIRDYTRNVKNFQGVLYSWDMKDGIPTNKPWFLFEIKGGKKKLVKTVVPALR